MIAQNFIGLFAPTGTPPAIIEQIAQATLAVMGDEPFLRSLTASGFEPYPASTPEKSAALRRGRDRPLGAGDQGDRLEARLSASPAIARPVSSSAMRNDSGLATRTLMSAAAQGRPKR